MLTMASQQVPGQLGAKNQAIDGCESVIIFFLNIPSFTKEDSVNYGLSSQGLSWHMSAPVSCQDAPFILMVYN